MVIRVSGAKKIIGVVALVVGVVLLLRSWNLPDAQDMVAQAMAGEFHIEALLGGVILALAGGAMTLTG